MLTKFYVQLKADVRQMYNGARVESIRAVKMTQKRPTDATSDLLVEFELDIPDELILPLKVKVELQGVQAAVTALQSTVKTLSP